MVWINHNIPQKLKGNVFTIQPVSTLLNTSLLRQPLCCELCVKRILLGWQEKKIQWCVQNWRGISSSTLGNHRPNTTQNREGAHRKIFRTVRKQSAKGMEGTGRLTNTQPPVPSATSSMNGGACSFYNGLNSHLIIHKLERKQVIFDPKGLPKKRNK